MSVAAYLALRGSLLKLYCREKVDGVVLVGEEDVDCGKTPSSVTTHELSMNDEDLVEELRGALEGSVQVPAVALRQDVEVVAGSQDDHFPLVGSVVVEKHISLPEGVAVFGIKVKLSKGERGSWTRSHPCVI